MIGWSLFYLILSVLVVLSAIWYLVQARRLIDLWRPLVQNVSSNRLTIRVGLLVMASILLIIALMRPQSIISSADEVSVVSEGRAVLIALDISRSMCAQDSKPSRIAHAKGKIKELLSQLRADRVGLLVFSGDALVLCPLTTDYTAFNMFLDNVAVEAVSSGTTSIGSALEKALSSFADQRLTGTRLVVLFTDGEDFSGHLPDVFEKIRAANMRICIVGVGSPDGGPIPVYDQRGNQSGFLKDRDGSVIISRPQTALMRELADKTAGLFVQSTGTHKDMVRVKKWIERFERSQSGEQQTGGGLAEQFFWFTGCAFGLLVLGFLV